MITAEAIETAKREGVPFTIFMADGRSYGVSAPDQIVTRKGQGWIIFLGEDFVPRMIPLLTITRIEYTK